MAAKHFSEQNAPSERKIDVQTEHEAHGGFKILVVACLLMLVAFLSTSHLIVPLCERFGWDAYPIGFSWRSAFAIVGFIVLGGASWLFPSIKAIFKTWRFMGYLIVLQLVLGVLALFLGPIGMSDEEIAAVTGETLTNNAIYYSMLSSLVGINEEVIFRGLLYGGLLAFLGGKRRGVLWAAILSSFVFGFVHVASDLDFSNMLGVAQGLMKTVETAMTGLIFCAAATEVQNLWGVITFHAYFDGIVLTGKLYTGLEGVGSYVSTDAALSTSSIALFVVMAAIYLPKTIKAVRMLRDIEAPYYGPFAKRLGIQSS